MKANELAKKLEEYSNVNFFIDCTYEQYDEDRIFKIKAATMLRQQQAEIEALKDLIEVMRRGQPNIDYDKELLKPTFVGRELTHEEIAEVYCEIPILPVSNGEVKMVFEFARAILRKAQEK